MRICEQHADSLRVPISAGPRRWATRGESNSRGAGVRKTRVSRFLPAGEDADRRPKPVRICEAAGFSAGGPSPPMAEKMGHPRRIELYAGRGR